jgi:hypothetical protein
MQISSLRALAEITPPDGRSIAFEWHPSSKGGISVMASDGGGLKLLAPEADRNGQPAWSHDGRFIYFTANRAGQSQIWKVPTTADRPFSRGACPARCRWNHWTAGISTCSATERFGGCHWKTASLQGQRVESSPASPPEIGATGCPPIGESTTFAAGNREPRSSTSISPAALCGPCISCPGPRCMAAAVWRYRPTAKPYSFARLISMAATFSCSDRRNR